jgi:hypothetical protein
MPELIEINGHVADAKSGIVIPGARVEAWDSESQEHRVLAAVDTDDKGGFVLAFETGAPTEALARDFPVRPDREPPGPRPEPPRLAPVHLMVLRDGEVLPSPNASRWDGHREVALLVDAGVAPDPAPAPPPPPRPSPERPATAEPAALTIAELGEALAATAASIQQELAHYPTSKGAFVLDDLDVELPVGFSVDVLGQLRVRIAGEEQQTSAGRLRLRMKPLLEPPEARSVTAPQGLETLGALSPETVSRLESERIYSVGDLLRVSRNAVGRRALEQLGIRDVAAVRERAEVVALPTLPPAVGEALVKAGVTRPAEFVATDAKVLAERLRGTHGEPVAAEDVQAWQLRTRRVIDGRNPAELDA